jgi:hypothetical protein
MAVVMVAHHVDIWYHLEKKGGFGIIALFSFL